MKRRLPSPWAQAADGMLLRGDASLWNAQRNVIPNFFCLGENYGSVPVYAGAVFWRVNDIMKLSQVLQLSSRDDPNSYSQDTFDAVDVFLEHFGEHDLARRLLNEAPAEADLIVIAQLSRILEWSTTDNGTALSHQYSDWLRDSSDERLLQLALHGLCTFPLRDHSERKVVLKRIANAHPRLRARCEEVLRQSLLQTTWFGRNFLKFWLR